MAIKVGKPNIQKILLLFMFIIPSIVLLLLISVGCSEKSPDIVWDYSDKEIINDKTSKPDSITINIYLDATESMRGFVSNAASVYDKFLDGIESSVAVGWKKTDIH